MTYEKANKKINRYINKIIKDKNLKKVIKKAKYFKSIDTSDKNKEIYENFDKIESLVCTLKNYKYTNDNIEKQFFFKESILRKINIEIREVSIKLNSKFGDVEVIYVEDIFVKNKIIDTLKSNLLIFIVLLVNICFVKEMNINIILAIIFFILNLDLIICNYRIKNNLFAGNKQEFIEIMNFIKKNIKEFDKGVLVKLHNEKMIKELEDINEKYWSFGSFD